MSAKARHRHGALMLCGPFCALRDEPGHTCGGRLQAHHVIGAQRLRSMWGRAHMYRWDAPSAEGFNPAWVERLRAVDVDELIADPRNACIVCELGHRQVELGRYTIPPHEHLRAFAADYGLEHYLDEVPV